MEDISATRFPPADFPRSIFPRSCFFTRFSLLRNRSGWETDSLVKHTHRVVVVTILRKTSTSWTFPINFGWEVWRSTAQGGAVRCGVVTTSTYFQTWTFLNPKSNPNPKPNPTLTLTQMCQRVECAGTSVCTSPSTAMTDSTSFLEGSSTRNGNG